MPSFKETLDLKRSSPAAVFHAFRTLSGRERYQHIFVEGYDDKNFYLRVASVVLEKSDEIRTYVCMGKNAMDRIIELLNKSGLPTDRILFIRDSDIDRYLNRIPLEPYVFATCGYSVENYVCALNAVRSFIITVFGVDPDEVALDPALEKHKISVALVFTWLTELFGRAIIHIVEGKKFDLNKVNVALAYNEAYRTGKIHNALGEDTYALCGLDQVSSRRKPEAIGAPFVEQDAMAWLRGKFLLTCTAEFIRFQYEEVKGRYKAGDLSRFNRKASPDFSENAIFERLCGFSLGTIKLRDAMKAAARE